MKRFVWILPAWLCLTIGAQAQGKINPTDPQPTCPMCPGTYIPVSELEAYTSKALAEKLLDQQVSTRLVDSHMETNRVLHESPGQAACIARPVSCR